MFRQIAKTAAQSDRIAGRIKAAEPNAAAIGPQESGQHPHTGGLARAVGAEQCHDFPALDLETEILNGGNRTETFTDSFCLDHPALSDRFTQVYRTSEDADNFHPKKKRAVARFSGVLLT